MTSVATEGAVPYEDYHRVVEENAKLLEKYQKLRIEHAKCEPYIENATKHYAAAKESAKQWTAYLTKKGLIKPAEELEAGEGTRPGVSSSGRTNKTCITSSQTTEGELDETPRSSARVDLNDEPEVVSVRSLKRKRNGSAHGRGSRVRIKVEPASPTAPIELHSDVYSSPVSKHCKPTRIETSDLDAQIGLMDTPRRWKDNRAQSEEVARPRTLLTATSSLSESDLPGNCGVAYVKVEPVEAARADRIAKDLQGSNILRQRSVNVPSISKHEADHANIRRKRRPEVAILSEDGDVQQSQVAPEREEHDSRSESSRRLDTLLQELSPNRQPLSKRPTSQTRARPKPLMSAPLSGELHNIEEKVPPKRESLTLKGPNGLEKSPSPPRPEHEPLRARQVHRLCLDDFRINPNYIGSEFAFADTIRGRDQRKCLPGCVDPQCCGTSFKKAVEMGVAQTITSDHQVLEEYLGSDYKTHIQAYSPEKRKELLLQARAHEFANTHSKHRQAFNRRFTPAGYWRTDMPSTQEEVQDRAQAYSLERARVEERWREAMREGRWLFRDE